MPLIRYLNGDIVELKFPPAGFTCTVKEGELLHNVGILEMVGVIKLITVSVKLFVNGHTPKVGVTITE